MKQRDITNRSTGKVLQVDYDYIRSLSEEGCCYCLSEQHVAILLAFIDYVGWPTRWYSPTDAEFDTDWLQAIQAQIGGRLMDDCGCGNTTTPGINPPTNQQYGQDGILEISYDGGLSYTDAPELDPRFSGTMSPPLPGDAIEDTKCQAANNGEEVVRSDLIEALNTGWAFAEVYALLLAILVPLTGLAAPPLAAVISGLIMITTVAVVQAAFTTEVYDLYKCILFCAMRDDQSFGTTEWSEVQYQIDQQIGGVAGLILEEWVRYIGPVGLTNSVRRPVGNYDGCPDCDCDDSEEWWYEFDFTSDDQTGFGWARIQGVWESGVGYKTQSGGCSNANRCVRIALDRRATNPESVLLGWIIELTPHDISNFYWGVYHTGLPIPSSPTTHNLLGVPTNIIDNSSIYEEAPEKIYSGTIWGGASGTVVAVKRIVLHGLGVNPFGGDNYTYDPENP
jgi:hypothetical protein